MTGTLLAGRYLLLEELGSGATATVYRARDRETDALVAVKTIHPGLLRASGLRRRMEREAHALALLDHPHVVRLHDAVFTEESAFVVMELVEGGSLASRVNRHGPLPPRMAVRAIREVCLGVEAAHEAGVVHRDLKPHNVLIGTDGRCRVADFGIARLLHDSASLTRTGLRMGTLGYMAPEQLTDAKRADHRADVFGIGATLYAVLNAAIPTSVPEALAAGEPAQHELLHWPLTRATLPEPEHRYQSVRRLRRVLDELLPRLEPDPPRTPSLQGARATEPVGEASGPTFIPEEPTEA